MLWALVTALVYLAAIASTDPLELAYAVIAALLIAPIIAVLRAQTGRGFVTTLGEIALYAKRSVTGGVSETLQLLGPHLLATLAGRAPVGRFVHVAVEPGGDDDRDRGRRAGWWYVGGLTPNELALFVDRDRLVAHQLIHRDSPTLHDRRHPT